MLLNYTKQNLKELKPIVSENFNIFLELNKNN